MIEITEHVRNVLLEVAKNKKIYVEGNFLKLLKAPKGDKEFIEYLKLCKEKDITTRKKRLEVTKQVQKQNGELVEKQKENDSLLGVGVITTVMYALALTTGADTQIIGSTWSNMFGILLTNAFSIVGTIMGVKYATEKE